MLMRSVFVAKEDHKRVLDMLAHSRRSLMEADAHLRALEFDMARAKTVAAKDIPQNVVALYSWVRLRMSDNADEVTCQLVMPAEADRKGGRISMLSPLGATIIGCRVGDSVIVDSNEGRREVTILGVFHSPSAAPPAKRSEPPSTVGTSTRSRWRRGPERRLRVQTTPSRARLPAG
jgi:regulator of nucleoside diphosphate kinase